MKHLIFGLVLLIGFSAKAGIDDFVIAQERVMDALVKHANEITVVYEDSEGEPAPEEEQLPARFQEVLLQNYKEIRPSEPGYLAAVTLSCDPDEVEEENRMIGARTYTCELVFSRAKYTYNNGNLMQVPDSEEEIVKFEITAIVAVNSNSEAIITSKTITPELY